MIPYKKRCVCGYIAVARLPETAREVIKDHCDYRRTQDPDTLCVAINAKNV